MSGTTKPTPIKEEIDRLLLKITKTTPAERLVNFIDEVQQLQGIIDSTEIDMIEHSIQYLVHLLVDNDYQSIGKTPDVLLGELLGTHFGDLMPIQNLLNAECQMRLKGIIWSIVSHGDYGNNRNPSDIALATMMEALYRDIWNRTRTMDEISGVMEGIRWLLTQCMKMEATQERDAHKFMQGLRESAETDGDDDVQAGLDAVDVGGFLDEDEVHRLRQMLLYLARGALKTNPRVRRAIGKFYE